MTRIARASFFATLVFVLATQSRAADVYTQQQDVVYGQVHGIALVMDIFRPVGKANGLALVDIASGAWHSDRGKIEDHKQAQMYDIFCGRGYTVFAVRPGSVTRFTALEMADHVKRGIRWVKAHAEEFKIDPDRLALGGASAGGHLTCLTAATTEDAKPDAKDPLDRPSSHVKACMAFFPPTDFLDWGGVKYDPDKPQGLVPSMIGNLLFVGGPKGRSKEELLARIEAISPARIAHSKMPPLLLIHGDADPLVPLQQSELMLAALKKAGVECELIVKAGGAHPWPTIHEEVAIVADWFDKHLAASSAVTASAALPAP